MRNLRADIDGPAALVEGVEVFGERLHVKSMPSERAVPGMSSTPSISWMSHSSVPGFTARTRRHSCP